MCGVFDTTTENYHEDEPNTFRVVNLAEINEYIAIETTSSTVVRVSSMAGAQIFAGTVQIGTEKPKGLYVKLGTWKRMAEAND